VVKEETKSDNALNVDEPKILEVVCSKTANTGYTLQSLIIMTENADHAEKASEYCKQLVAETIIWDFMNSPSF
jgi:hypothetical protein